MLSCNAVQCNILEVIGGKALYLALNGLADLLYPTFFECPVLLALSRVQCCRWECLGLCGT